MLGALLRLYFGDTDIVWKCVFAFYSNWKEEPDKIKEMGKVCQLFLFTSVLTYAESLWLGW